MATHRHRSVVTVVVTSAALVVAVAVPAQAAVKRTTKVRSATGTSAHHTLASRLSTTTKERAVFTRDRRIKVVATPSPTASPTADALTTPVSTPTTVPAPLVTTEPTTGPLVETVTETVGSLVGSPSGQAAPRGDLPGWKQTYVEDFTRANVATGAWPGAYTDHWYAYADGVKDTSKNGTYMPSKVLSVHDGVLDYHIRTENGQHLVSAPCLKDTYHQSYGRYSVRFRADSMPGYKNAWLLWPDSQRWPDDGEIDFPEGDLNGSIGAFAHHASSSGAQDAFSTGASFQAWHTATIEWLPGSVTFVLDGKTIGVSTKDVPATAMHWVLQTETALSGAAPSASVSGHVLVDWVTLYERA